MLQDCVGNLVKGAIGEEDFLERLITFSISFRVIGPSSIGVVGAGGSGNQDGRGNCLG